MTEKNHQCSPCPGQSFVELGKSCDSWEAVFAECQALLVQVIGCGGTDKKRAGFDGWQASTVLALSDGAKNVSAKDDLKNRRKKRASAVRHT